MHRAGWAVRSLAVIAATLLCILAAAPSAHAHTIRQVPNILGEVGGTVYIPRTPDGSTGQYWANGSWHDFSTVLPANPASQDGPSVPIGNGWYIWWNHSSYGVGSYQVWRYPDNGQVTYSGTTWPGFKVRLNRIGYTVTGQPVDAVIDFSQVYAWQFDGLPEPSWFTPFEISTLYGPLVQASASTGSAAIGAEATFTTSFVRSGTDTLIDASNEVDILYWDIDQPVHHQQGGGSVSDFTSAWREGIHLVSGYKDEVVLGTSTTVVPSDNNTWFRSGANDPSSVPTDFSSVLTKAGPRYVTQWRGEAASTGMGFDTTVVKYPTWAPPLKTPPQQVRQRGEVASFDVEQTLPYVVSTNQASSIVMKDTLDPALDASRATVRVFKGPNADQDVTANWTITVSGQTVTATAKNTGHGFAEDKHVFRITAPVSATADLSAYPRADSSGDRYWAVPNQASVSINGTERLTPRVTVLVPYEAKGTIGLTATKKLRGGQLAPGQFIFDLTGPAGTLDSKTNDVSGQVAFTELSYTQADIGKTFTYTIAERNTAVPGYVYDSHVETVTVEVQDDGLGKLKVVATYNADQATFTNEQRQPLAVVKQSSDNHQALAGAQFTLYRDDGDGVFSGNDQPAAVFSDPALTTPVPGGAVTTGTDGKAVYHGLAPQTSYWLKETRAPSGYQLDPTPYLVTVSEQGVLSTVTAGGTPVALPVKDTVATITIADDPLPALPTTAGPGTTGLVFVGSFLLTGGAGLLLVRRRPDRHPTILLTPDHKE
ncbi:MAG: SpaA isopeptide-forming pilin-related protein [Actinomycetia bacterium]|nr:SpaA isopeptide-forming pilin-related protein [Actinomycetes bacterium]